MGRDVPPMVLRGRIGKRGTLVIPAPLRRKLGFDDGTPVTAEIRDGGLFIRSTAVGELTDTARRELIEAAVVAYAALRADPEAWAEELAERAVWQQISGETLEPEVWTENDYFPL